MSSVAKKTLMALTGLFLCLFLVVHLMGNSLLFLPEADARPSFNSYAKLLSGLTVIQIAAFATYGAILAHAVLAAVVTRKNRRSAGEAYAHQDPGATSAWYTRWMGLLGTVLLVFIVIHLWDFWYPYKFGDSVSLDADGNKDLYAIVSVAFLREWRVVLYVAAMLALAAHLYQGVYNGLRSLGLHHSVYSQWFKLAGRVFAIILALGFAAIPITMYLTQQATN